MQEWSCARQNCSELHHFSAAQPELILISVSPCLADSYGNIEPALEPVWALAVAGSSSIMWEKSTETLWYSLAQVKSIRQWVSGAGGLGAAQSPALGGIPQILLLPSSSTSAPALCADFVGKFSLPGSASAGAAAPEPLSRAQSPLPWLGVAHPALPEPSALSQLGSQPGCSFGSSAVQHLSEGEVHITLRSN